MHCKIRVCLPVCLPKRRTSGTTTQNFSESAHECHETNPQHMPCLQWRRKELKVCQGVGGLDLSEIFEKQKERKEWIWVMAMYIFAKKRGEGWLYPPPSPHHHTHTHTHPVSTPIPWLVFTVIMFTHSVAIIMILNILIIILQG